MTETGAASPERLTHWIAFLVFSGISLGSIIEAISHQSESGQNTTKPEQIWAITSGSIVFLLTLTTVFMHFIPVTAMFIVGTRLEGVMSIVLIALWTAIVGVVTDAKYGLAVNSSGAVSNGNIYYFSWAGFFCSLHMVVSFLRSVYHIDIADHMRNRSTRLDLWSALLASSLIVLGCSVNVLSTSCVTDTINTIYCSRTKMGVGFGLLSSFFSLAMVAWKIATLGPPFLLETGVSITLILSNFVSVILLTSQQGPGAPLGNLYYFSWLSFLLSAIVLGGCFEDFNASKILSTTDSGVELSEDHDVDIEDDGI